MIGLSHEYSYDMAETAVSLSQNWQTAVRPLLWAIRRCRGSNSVTATEITWRAHKTVEAAHAVGS